MVANAWTESVSSHDGQRSSRGTNEAAGASRRIRPGKQNLSSLLRLATPFLTPRQLKPQHPNLKWKPTRGRPGQAWCSWLPGRSCGLRCLVLVLALVVVVPSPYPCYLFSFPCLCFIVLPFPSSLIPELQWGETASKERGVNTDNMM